MNSKQHLGSLESFEEKAAFMSRGNVTVGIVYGRTFDCRYIGKVRGIPVGRSFENPSDAREMAVSYREYWRQVTEDKRALTP